MSHVNLYCCRDGNYLLSPDCMQASIEAQAIHGPLNYLGSIACAKFGKELCKEIEAKIANDLFVLIAKDRIDLRRLELDEAVVGRIAGSAIA